MRKYLLLLLLFFGVSNAQIINFPDANFKARLLAANSAEQIAIDIPGQNVSVDTNGDGEIEVAEAMVIGGLFLEGSNIASLEGIQNFSNLLILYADNNPIGSFDATILPALISLDLQNCQLNYINVSDTLLSELKVTNNQLSTLDLTNCYMLDIIEYSGNPMISLFVQNVAMQSIAFTTFPPSLQYVCGNPSDIVTLQSIANSQGLTGIEINSYCTFVPAGNYNTITGSVQFDADNNGCNASDPVMPHVPINLTNSTATVVLGNNSGIYTAYANATTVTLTPLLEDGAYFSIMPPNAVITFNDNNNNVATQNFCVTPIGIHPDLEIIIVPQDAPEPGFDSFYKVFVRNKGNQSASGSFTFSFNDSVFDFVNSTPAPMSQSSGLIGYNFSNLLPFQNMLFSLTLNLNGPMETPPVNIGNMVTVTAAIAPSMDETPSDNQASLSQIVVGSFDPNDIICLEGENVDPSQIGEYLHYVINFENTGTSAAINVVVKDIIDPLQFDISSLQLLYTSHLVETRIIGNNVEFIFENIGLEPNEKGQVVFKIRSKNTLVTGDTVSNKANIFFDYNFPIETNTASTTFQALGVGENNYSPVISIHPNPTRNLVNVQSNEEIQTLQLYDVQGRLLITNIINSSETLMDLSAQQSGIYFIRITTEIGIKSQKIIKE